METRNDINTFMQWFRSSGGYVDTKSIGITEFSDSGRGAIALCNIPEGHTLFTLPRTITLSTRTSSLPSLFGIDAWHSHGLHKGWAGLILCMMWEDAWAHEPNVMDGSGVEVHARWGPYMHSLPTTFDTPIFWSAEELEELKGTAVIDKLGRDDAERVYHDQLFPAIKTSPILFPPSHHAKWYTLDAYHRAGSRILSRSFTISHWTGNHEVEEDVVRDGEVGDERSSSDEAGDSSVDPSLNIDDSLQPALIEIDNDVMEDEDEDEEEEDPSDVAMVPMADLLNARWGSENAKLFCESSILRMTTTKNIKQGEQIFNTYGDPPNSVLLRRYGHVDYIRLKCTSGLLPDCHSNVHMKNGDDANAEIFGNPSDVVEIRADLVVEVVRSNIAELKESDVYARIEWWLDECEEDTFVLSLPESDSRLTTILLPALVSLTRLLILSEPDFKVVRSKKKLPKGKLKKDDIENNKKVLDILDEVFKQREGMYAGGSVEDDERLLSGLEALSKCKRHAVIVRQGEKRILRYARQILQVMRTDVNSSGRVGCGNEKDRIKNDNGGGKKRVVCRGEGDRGWKKSRR